MESFDIHPTVHVLYLSPHCSCTLSFTPLFTFSIFHPTIHILYLSPHFSRSLSFTPLFTFSIFHPTVHVLYLSPHYSHSLSFTPLFTYSILLHGLSSTTQPINQLYQDLVDWPKRHNIFTIIGTKSLFNKSIQWYKLSLCQ